MKKLNTDLIQDRLEELGYSPSDLAKELKFSRQSISNWLNRKKFPRPAKLLKLARVLNLTFDQIVIKGENSSAPVIAFRKKGRHKISKEYIEDAIDKGYLLEHLVDYLPFDNLSNPPVLKNPKIDYEYIHKVASTVRKEIGKSGNEEIEFEDLIDFFNENHAVIIPVLGGHKKNHENALHVFLPSSMTTWVYLNLDSNINDFKFWMAHELGHVKAPTLRDDEAENFADMFAGSLLVSQELAESEYLYIRKLPSGTKQVNRIIEVAKDLTVSPLTVYYEINRYAEYANKTIVDLEFDKRIYRANSAFCSQYPTVTELLFKDELPPSPKEYIKTCEEEFETPFFSSLRSYLVKEKKPPSFVQSVMSMAPVDAQALYDEIC